MLLREFIRESLFAKLGEQILRVDGLGENLKFIAAGTGVFQQIRRGGLAGEEKNFAGRQESANVNCGLNAVHVGHDDVADDEVGFFAAGHIDSIVAGIDGGGIETRLIQE